MQHTQHLGSLMHYSAGTYKASMVQAFQRTVKEAHFAMVIVDAPNLSLDDLKVYWAAGQVSKHTSLTGSIRVLTTLELGIQYPCTRTLASALGGKLHHAITTMA